MLDRARWLRRDRQHPIDVGRRLRAGAWKGMLAGAGGVAAMTLGEKLEQRLTGRPNSYMPAHTLERLLGMAQRRDSERRMLNLGMHVGQAILLGAWRGLMAEGGLRGARASALFTVIRLANDQTLENITGQGRRRGRGPATNWSSTCCTRASTASRPASSPTHSQRTLRRGWRRGRDLPRGRRVLRRHGVSERRGRQ
jgi:hypothetical protein